MECPRCNATIVDEEPAFCPRCGAPLGAPEAAATERLDSPEAGEREAGETAAGEPEGDTGRIPAGESPEPAAAVRTAARDGASLVGDAASGVRSYLTARGWPRVTEAASVGFLAVLAIGAGFVVLAKLLNSGFGSGENPLWMFTRIVLAGLWSIGVTIERGDAGSGVLAVSALLVVAWVLFTAARRTVGRAGATSPWERTVHGLKIGLPFALMCFAAALLFRIDADDSQIRADPAAALMVPLAWGMLFGALGGLSAGVPLRDLRRAAGERLDDFRAGIRDGVWAGALMLAATAVLSLGAVLLFLVGTLATARSVPLSASDAIVFLVALAAFLPNIVAGAAAFSLGAPIEFLARTIDGAEVERSASLIVGGEGARGYAYLLLVIPAAACLFGGYTARRRTTSAPAPVVLATAAVTYAFTLWVVVALTGVRVSQAFLGDGNYLVVSASPGATLLLAAAWAALFGYAGWRVAEQQESS